MSYKDILKVSKDSSLWLSSISAAAFIGSIGLIPALFAPFIQNKDTHNSLKLGLSFSIGTLLGEVFLHLLPEIWTFSSNHLELGVWVLIGILSFVIIEIFFSLNENKSNEIIGCVNIVANIVDNFTHGLAIGASFISGTKAGIITTFALLIHEIPHEFSDYAILMKSGFSRSRVIKIHIITAIIAIIGAVISLNVESGDYLDSKINCISAFAAGTFMYIALISILPSLLKEDDPKESIKQFIVIILGIVPVILLNEEKIIEVVLLIPFIKEK